MNDERTGQLCRGWSIPSYAQNRLWLESESEAVRCEGEKGLFALEAPASVLTLRWGGEEGTALTQLRWQADTLDWAGQVRVGGMVEAIHITSLAGLEIPIAVISISAQALRPEILPYPAAAQRDQANAFDLPDFQDSLSDEYLPRMLPLLAPDESPLVTIAQDAMFNRSPLHLYGRLAAEGDTWQQFFALPIIWESVTIFAP